MSTNHSTRRRWGRAAASWSEESINAMLEQADQLVGAYRREGGVPAGLRAGFTATSGRSRSRCAKLRACASPAVIERCKERETSVERPSSKPGYHAPHRGRRRIHVGRRASPRRHGLKPQHQGFQGPVRSDAGPWPADTRTCLRQRHLPEAQPGALQNVAAVMAAIGVNEDGYREVIRRGLHESMLARLPVVAQVPACAHSWATKAAEYGVARRRGLPQRQIPALHRALLPQRLAKVPKSKAAGGSHTQAIHAMESPGGRRRGREDRSRRPGIVRLKEVARSCARASAETCEMPRGIGGASARTTQSSA